MTHLIREDTAIWGAKQARRGEKRGERGSDTPYKGRYGDKGG